MPTACESFTWVKEDILWARRELRAYRMPEIEVRIKKQFLTQVRICNAKTLILTQFNYY